MGRLVIAGAAVAIIAIGAVVAAAPNGGGAPGHTPANHVEHVDVPGYGSYDPTD